MSTQVINITNIFVPQCILGVEYSPFHPVPDRLQSDRHGNASTTDFGALYLGVHNVRVQETGVTAKSHRSPVILVRNQGRPEQRFQYHKVDFIDGHA